MSSVSSSILFVPIPSSSPSPSHTPSPSPSPSDFPLSSSSHSNYSYDSSTSPSPSSSSPSPSPSPSSPEDGDHSSQDEVMISSSSSPPFRESHPPSSKSSKSKIPPSSSSSPSPSPAVFPSLSDDFSEWELVSPSCPSYPKMSYEGYCSLSHSSLKPSTKMALSRCTNGESVEHDNPWKIIYGNGNHQEGAGAETSGNPKRKGHSKGKGKVKIKREIKTNENQMEMTKEMTMTREMEMETEKEMEKDNQSLNDENHDIHNDNENDPTSSSSIGVIPSIPPLLPKPYDLYRRVNPHVGSIETKLVANCDIAERTVIDFIGGKLQESFQSEAENVDRSHHLYLDRGYLLKFFGYQGKHPLCLSLKNHRNAASLIRDPSTFLDEEEELRPDLSAYNVQCDLCFDKKSHLFFWILYAWADIKKGEELLSFLSLGQWYSRDHKRLFLAARINHWHHRNAMRLEKSLFPFDSQYAEKHNVELSKNIKKLFGPILSPLKEWKFLGDSAERDAAMDLYFGPNNKKLRISGMRHVDIGEAFARAHCSYIKKSFWGKSITEETKNLMKNIPNYFPKELVLGDTTVPVDRKSIEKLLSDGHDETQIGICEVINICEPVRYFTPPWYPAFGLVAKKEIPQGTFVFTYAGQIEEVVQNPDSVYVYDIDSESVAQSIPKYEVPRRSLLIDANTYGGIARFVNDCRFRRSDEVKGEGSSINLGVTFVFFEGQIHIVFYTKRRILSGEELINEYGDEFWKICIGQMLRDHREYYNFITNYNSKLLSQLRRDDRPVPSKPDLVIENEFHFMKKSVPYVRESDFEWENPNDDQWEIESILAKGIISGQIHYKVKWEGFDHCHNSWEPEKNIFSKEIIQQFEDKLKKEGKNTEINMEMEEEDDKDIDKDKAKNHKNDKHHPRRPKSENSNSPSPSPSTKKTAKKKKEKENDEEKLPLSMIKKNHKKLKSSSSPAATHVESNTMQGPNPEFISSSAAASSSSPSPPPHSTSSFSASTSSLFPFPLPVPLPLPVFSVFSSSEKKERESENKNMNLKRNQNADENSPNESKENGEGDGDARQVFSSPSDTKQMAKKPKMTPITTGNLSPKHREVIDIHIDIEE